MAKTKVITQGYDPSTKEWYPVYDTSAHNEIDELSAAIKDFKPLTPEQEAAIAKVGALYNTTITSTNGSVEVTPTTDASGNVKYDLKVSADVHVDPTTIQGDGNLTTAYYDTAAKVWHVDGINHDYATTADVKSSADGVKAWVESQHYLTGAGDLNDYETTAHASTAYQPKGDYVVPDDLTAYQPKGDYETTAHASTTYQLKGDYVTTNALTAQLAVEEEKADGKYIAKSFSSNFVTTADADRKYQPKGDYATTAELKAGMETVTAWAMDTFLTGVDLSNYATTSYVAAGDDAVTAWVNNQSYLKQDDIKDFATTAYVTAGDSQVTAWAMDTFLTGVDLTPYETTAHASTAYQAAGDYATNTQLSNATTALAAGITAVGKGLDDLTKEYEDFLAEYSGTSASFYTEVASGDNIAVTETTATDGHKIFTLSGHSPVQLVSQNNSVKIELNSKYVPEDTDSQHLNIEVNLPEADFGSFYSNATEITQINDWTHITMEKKYGSSRKKYDEEGEPVIDPDTGEQVLIPFTLLNLASNVLYHVDINVKFKRTGTLEANYEKIEFKDANTATARTFAIGMLDASTTQEQYFNISYDFRGEQALSVFFKPESVGWTVEVMRLDIHDVNGGMSPGSTESMAEEIQQTTSKVEEITSTVDNRIITNMPYSNITVKGTIPKAQEGVAMVGSLTTIGMKTMINVDGAAMGAFLLKSFTGDNAKIAFAIYEYDEATSSLAWVANTDWENVQGKTGYVETRITDVRTSNYMNPDKLYYFMALFGSALEDQAEAIGMGAPVPQLNVMPYIVHGCDRLKDLTNKNVRELKDKYQTITGDSAGSTATWSSYNIFVGFRNLPKEL